MENAAAFFCECEATAPAGGLIVDTVDLQTRIMAEQKRADGAVADKENIARSISAQDLFGLMQNAPLRIDRTLPAPNIDERVPEELIGNRLELLCMQKARRRSVVLV